MYDLANDGFHLSGSQGVSYFREITGNCDTVSILRGVALSRQPSVAT